jgi:hypothetical protein
MIHLFRWNGRNSGDFLRLFISEILFFKSLKFFQTSLIFVLENPRKIAIIPTIPALKSIINLILNRIEFLKIKNKMKVIVLSGKFLLTIMNEKKYHLR